jgi:hypothetical protein
MEPLQVQRILHQILALEHSCSPRAISCSSSILSELCSSIKICAVHHRLYLPDTSRGCMWNFPTWRFIFQQVFIQTCEIHYQPYQGVLLIIGKCVIYI